MEAATWSQLINTYEVNTRGSNRKMLSLSTDTDSKLLAENSDADILIIYTNYHPVCEAYRIVNLNYGIRVGTYRGATVDFELMMFELGHTKIKEWEGSIRAVYIEDSAKEIALLPEKRKPFQMGTYEERITAVGVLAGKLALDSNFTVLAPIVQSYYNTLRSTRLSQQTSEGSLNELRDLRESQRVLLADALYGVQGRLMFKYRHDRIQIARFFDLSLLRREANEGDAEIKVTELGSSTTLIDSASVVLVRISDGERFEAVTGLDGIADLRNLPAGDYQLHVSHAHYQDFETPVHITAGETFSTTAELKPEI